MFTTKQSFLNAGGDVAALAGGKRALSGLSDDLLKLLEEYLSALSYYTYVMGRRNIKYIRSAMEAAKPMVGVELEDLNSDPLLLNTPSASYRLVDGLEGRQEHNWKDYCTKVTAVEPGDLAGCAL